MPERIQRQRVKGYRLPESAVHVGRPSRWGNPYRVGDIVGEVLANRRRGDEPLWQWGGLRQYDDAHVLTAAEAVEAFERYLPLAVGPSGYARTYEAKLDLGGRDLACWCAIGTPCHADVLLKVAAAPD